MNEAAELQCWRCGHTLAELPLPLSFRATCPACEIDLHVCRLCLFYDTSAADACREPIAERVTNKERNNFCDCFRPRPGAHQGRDPAAAAQRDALGALFGLEDDGTAAPGDAAEAARQELDALFGRRDD